MQAAVHRVLGLRQTASSYTAFWARMLLLGSCLCRPSRWGYARSPLPCALRSDSLRMRACMRTPPGVRNTEFLRRRAALAERYVSLWSWHQRGCLLTLGVFHGGNDRGQGTVCQGMVGFIAVLAGDSGRLSLPCDVSRVQQRVENVPRGAGALMVQAEDCIVGQSAVAPAAWKRNGGMEYWNDL